MSKLSVKINETKTKWESIKAWFKNSWTIFLARMTMLTGVITGVIGAMDLSPLWSTLQTGTYLSKDNLIAMGIGFLLQGIAFEFARRRNL